MGEHKRSKLKRRERRKQQQEDKRRAAPAAALLPVSGKPKPSPSAARMSDVLEQVARPLLDRLPEGSGLHGMRSVMLLAGLGWNAAVGSSPKGVEKVFQELSHKLTETSRQLSKEALPIIQLLAERKRQLFPNDDRLVLDVDVEDRGDHFYITAASMHRPY